VARDRIEKTHEMNFQNGILLSGAALVAVPIILHLIMRRQPKQLVFPAVQFIRQRELTNKRRLRFRHLLLLVARCAVIAVVALMLARPSISPEHVGRTAVLAAVLILAIAAAIASAALNWFRDGATGGIILAGVTFALFAALAAAAFQLAPSSDMASALGTRQSPVAAALVFDTTPRMSYRHENKSRIEAAQKIAHWLVDEFPSDSEVAVLNARSDSSAFAVDRGAARRKIDALKITPHAQPLPVAITEAIEQLKDSPHQRREVYVFTDLAKVSWPPDAAAKVRDRLAAHAGTTLYLIDVGVSDPHDFALGDLNRLESTLAQGGAVQIGVDLIHTGGGGSRTVEVRLYNPDPTMATDQKPDARSFTVRGRQTASSDANQSQRLSFELRGLAQGVYQGAIALVEEDGLVWNDRRYFTLQVEPPHPVLIAAPNPVEGYALFLTQALAPKLADRRFTCETIDLAQLGQKPLEELRRYSAIALVDPTGLADDTWSLLADYAKLGGGVAVFLGRNARPLEAFNSPAAQSLLPAKLERPQPAADRPFSLVTNAGGHPITSRFPDTTIPWYSFPVWRFWRLDEMRPSASVPVKFNSGSPAVVEEPILKGRVVLMTTPISDPASDRAWNWLPTGDDPWPFVMLMDGIFLHLVGSADVKLNYTVGEAASVPIVPPRPSITLTTPLGDAIGQPIDPAQGRLVVSATESPGSYRVRAGGTSDRLDAGFSVNLPAAESRFERLDNTNLDELLGEGNYRLARTEEEIQRNVSLGRVGVRLFPWLAMVLAILLAAELAMGHWFYRRATPPS
jgi:hypothetical protein